MTSILLGLITFVAGSCVLWMWRDHVLVFLQGLLPLSLIFAGAVAVIMGCLSIGDRSKNRNAGKKDHG